MSQPYTLKPREIILDFLVKEKSWNFVKNDVKNHELLEGGKPMLIKTTCKNLNLKVCRHR